MTEKWKRISENLIKSMAIFMLQVLCPTIVFQRDSPKEIFISVGIWTALLLDSCIQKIGSLDNFLKFAYLCLSYLLIHSFLKEVETDNQLLHKCMNVGNRSSSVMLISAVKMLIFPLSVVRNTGKKGGAGTEQLTAKSHYII